RVALAQAIDRFLVDLPADLAEELVREQTAAHPDLPVDSPDGQLDAFLAQCQMPGADMVIDAVDERPVEVEEECRIHRFPTGGAVSFMIRKIGKTHRLTRAIIAPGAIAQPVRSTSNWAA